MKNSSSVLNNYFSTKPVLKAYLFGSQVRNQATDTSDIDILVDLDYTNGADFFTFIAMQEELSQLLHRPVDLVSSNGLSPYIKPIIEKEKVLVYEKSDW